ncbi:uncharacterized protein LOC113368125 [Ctenocephalides felis]|uniref:uncharacterized protein LOC113368125 n=1 Tax=Ctenocephalides felis TaxID=7515 RepID=UPI000E6E38B8|nr:uncharacterized protein LOC113368125 [Ctenocephalides felis]
MMRIFVGFFLVAIFCHFSTAYNTGRTSSINSGNRDPTKSLQYYKEHEGGGQHPVNPGNLDMKHYRTSNRNQGGSDFVKKFQEEKQRMKDNAKQVVDEYKKKLDTMGKDRVRQIKLDDEKKEALERLKQIQDEQRSGNPAERGLVQINDNKKS